MRRFGRFIPLRVWRMRYVKKGFGRFIPLRLYCHGSKSKGSN